MSERALWHRLRAALCPYGWLLRVENIASPGTPDVAYCFTGGHAGWFELKYLKNWPIRAKTPVRIPTLTADQCTCLEEIEAAGGAAWLLLQVGPWYGLLPPVAARAIFKRQAVRANIEQYGAEGWYPAIYLRKLMKKTCD